MTKKQITRAVAEAIENKIEFRVSNTERIKCDGCGKYIRNDDAYVFPETSWERGGGSLKFSHVYNECIGAIQNEEKRQREESCLKDKREGQYGS